MKKLVTLFIFLVITFSISTVSAKVVRLEGENYTEKSYSGCYNRKYSKFSNGGALYSNVTAIDNNCRLTYYVTLTEDSIYNIEGVTSKFDSFYTTDFYIRINDGEEMVLYPEVLEDYSNWDINMSKYNFGNFRLNAGDNKFEIIFRKDDDQRYESKYINCFDYFDFIPVTPKFKLNNILTQSDTANVFTEDENAVIRFDFTALANEEKVFKYSVYDINGRTRVKGSVKVDARENKATLDLGRMYIGWYRLEISGIEADETKIFFCVVPKNDKKQHDSPFGIDKFDADLKSSEKMFNTAGVIGIDMMRSHVDPYFAYKHENYLDSHEDVHQEAKDAAGVKSMMIYPYFYIDGIKNAPDNLIEAYEMNKKLSSQYKGKGYAYEIWNEEEADFFSQPADVFASFFKAAAIGISDGDSDAIKFPGGFGGTPDNFFVRLLLRNDVSEYSDAYAYHNHKGNETYNDFIEGVAKSHTNTSLAYDPTKPVWVTEAGLSMSDVDSNGTPSDKSLISQARYYVVSTVQQLAYGTDKSFWFRMEHFIENGTEWGSYDAQNNPYPVICAIAMLTDKLGSAEFKGTLRTTGDTEGYLFNNGENDVAVLWTNSEGRCQLYTENSVKVTDNFGNTKVYSPVRMPGGGMVNIPVSFNPVFIEFSGSSDERNYFTKRAIEKNTDTKVYDIADRIVLQQLWQEQDMYESKTQGYALTEENVQAVTVNVYNFNNTAQSGVLNISSGSSVRDAELVDINQNSFDFSIKPMSSQSFEIQVNINENAEPGEIGFLKLSAELSNGSVVSDSIAAFYYNSDERNVLGYEFFENYDNPSAWGTYNHAVGVSVNASTPEDGVVEFNITSENDNAWYWPIYTLSEYATDEEGITFWIRSMDGSERNVNIYAYCTDGAYWLGGPNAISYDGEWKQIIIPWHKFLVFTSNGYEGGFDPAKIRKIGIGSYAPQGESSYQIKELGFYNSESPADMSDMGKTIRITGIDEGEIYRINQKIRVEADVDTDREIDVRIGDEYIDNYELSDGKIIIDYVPKERGTYDLHIISTDSWNYKNSASVSFIVK